MGFCVVLGFIKFHQSWRVFVTMPDLSKTLSLEGLPLAPSMAHLCSLKVFALLNKSPLAQVFRHHILSHLDERASLSAVLVLCNFLLVLR